MSRDVQYPNITVQLTGQDGNAYAVLGAVSAALKKAGVNQVERAKFMEEATAGDYNHLLTVCMQWVDVR